MNLALTVNAADEMWKTASQFSKLRNVNFLGIEWGRNTSKTRTCEAFHTVADRMAAIDAIELDELNLKSCAVRNKKGSER